METRRMCPHCRAFITTHDRVCPYCNEKVGPRAIDRRAPGEILGGFIPTAHFTTVVILLVNFGLYIATVIYSMRAGNNNAFLSLDAGTLFNFGAKYPPAQRAGEWWRLVTAGFLHGGLLHIAMNSWVFFDVGAQVEEIYGTARLLVFYVVSSIFGFYASSWWSPSISIGASAALMGLIGAMIALSAHHRSAMTAAIRSTYIRWVIYILLIGFLPGIGIDNAAHIGGLAAGFGLAYIAGLPREGSPKEQIWRIAAVVCVAATAFSFFEMFEFLTRGAPQF